MSSRRAQRVKRYTPCTLAPVSGQKLVLFEARIRGVTRYGPRPDGPRAASQHHHGTLAATNRMHLIRLLDRFDEAQDAGILPILAGDFVVQADQLTGGQALSTSHSNLRVVAPDGDALRREQDADAVTVVPCGHSSDHGVMRRAHGWTLSAPTGWAVHPRRAPKFPDAGPRIARRSAQRRRILTQLARGIAAQEGCAME
jgi:hypothetical protein